jgi:hypothetical protein
MTMTQTQTPAATIDLQKFCATDEDRLFRLKETFVLGKWKYASDSRIIVRVLAEGEPQTTDDGADDGTARLPPVEKVLQEPTGQWQAWPTGDQSEVIEREVDCKRCDCGTIGCQECGYRSCPDCIGGKKKKMWRTVGNHYIAGNYDTLISQLPNVQWATGYERTAALPFRFDGGEGRVMGCSNPTVD